MAKYKDLKSLCDAIRSKEVDIDREYPDPDEPGETVRAILWLDNDTTNMHLEGETVFSMHPAELLEQALALLGVPSEGV